MVGQPGQGHPDVEEDEAIHAACEKRRSCLGRQKHRHHTQTYGHVPQKWMNTDITDTINTDRSHTDSMDTQTATTQTIDAQTIYTQMVDT